MFFHRFGMLGKTSSINSIFFFTVYYSKCSDQRPPFPPFKRPSNVVFRCSHRVGHGRRHSVGLLDGERRQPSALVRREWQRRPKRRGKKGGRSHLARCQTWCFYVFFNVLCSSKARRTFGYLWSSCKSQEIAL